MNDLGRLDFETRSMMELRGKTSVGLHNYATHESTRVLMLAYKLPGYEKPKLWFPHTGPMPEDLLARLMDPTAMWAAFNSTFERYMLKYKLSIDIPAERFQDPQASARYLSMPSSLEEVGKILGLPVQFQKDERGVELIDLFSKPKKAKKKRGEEQKWYFNDWNSHPKEFEEFGEYCVQDVIAEEEISRREEVLGAYPLPEFERKVWVFDQKVNDRGMPVDVPFVEKMYKLAVRAKQTAKDEANRITGLNNANSVTQLLPWLRERGYEYNTLRKGVVAKVLMDTGNELTPEARVVLEMRKEAASTSYTKLSAILRQVSPDGFLRNQFIYMGSSRCGRWSGNAVQLHNMARPDGIFEKMDNIKKARAMVYAEDYEGLNSTFVPDPKKPDVKMPALLVIRSLVRTVFSANPVPAHVNQDAIEDDDE